MIPYVHTNKYISISIHPCSTVVNPDDSSSLCSKVVSWELYDVKFAMKLAVGHGNAKTNLMQVTCVCC